MTKYTEHQVLAISRMAQGTPEYNSGVLESLGRGELAMDYASTLALYNAADAAMDQACKGLDEIFGTRTPEQAAAIQRRQDAYHRLGLAWAPIQAIINSVQA